MVSTSQCRYSSGVEHIPLGSLDTVVDLTHYNDVIMNAMAPQITSLTIVYSTVYSRRRSKKTSKLRVSGLCEGNSPVTGEFPAQRASNTENVSIWWRHHVLTTGQIRHRSSWVVGLELSAYQLFKSGTVLNLRAHRRSDLIPFWSWECIADQPCHYARAECSLLSSRNIVSIIPMLIAGFPCTRPWAIDGGSCRWLTWGSPLGWTPHHAAACGRPPDLQQTWEWRHSLYTTRRHTSHWLIFNPFIKRTKRRC